MADPTQTPPPNIHVEDLPAPKPDQTGKMVKFVGQLDESNIDNNSKIIYDVIAQHPKKLFLLLDMSKLEYMNSKSIGYLTDWFGKVTEGEGKIVISSAPSGIMDILTAVGITELVKCYPTFDEAKTNLFA